MRSMTAFGVGRGISVALLLFSAGCWASFSGANSATSTPLPDGLRYTQVEVGGGPGCALRSDGAVVCWPEHFRSNGSDYPPPGKYSSLETAWACFCVLGDDGQVDCGGPSWGPWSHMKPPCGGAPEGFRFLSISTGDFINCGVTTDHSVHCWGEGLAISLDAHTPGGFADVVVGEQHLCLLTNSGNVACYGDEAPGCMSAPAEQFRQITINSVYGDQVCGVTSAGGLRCWGYGELDPDHKADRDAVTKAKITFSPPIDVSAALSVIYAKGTGIGIEGSQAIWEEKEKRLKTESMGNGVGLAIANFGAQAAIAIMSMERFPEGRQSRVRDLGLDQEPEGEFERVATSRNMNCAIRDNGSLVCWGEDCDSGAHLCNPPPGRYVDVSVGVWCACAVNEDGQIRCWGSDLGHVCTPP